MPKVRAEKAVQPMLLELHVKKYSQAQLDDVQGKFDLVFPPDLVALLREGGLASHDWSDEIKIRSMLAWPMETLLFDVENNGLWWTEWGPRPEWPESRREVVACIIERAPRLIPLYSHRFLPQTPSEAGNPVFRFTDRTRSTTALISRTTSKGSLTGSKLCPGPITLGQSHSGPIW